MYTHTHRAKRETLENSYWIFFLIFFYRASSFNTHKSCLNVDVHLYMYVSDASYKLITSSGFKFKNETN